MRFTQLAAILPVRDVRAALERYKRLGFDGAVYEELNADRKPFYGFVWRDEVNLHLALAADLDPHANPTAVYLYVEDPDAVFAEWSAVSPDGELRKPVDTNWGMREMSYADPDGNLLRIGRGLKRDT
jgi:catechol 2,3-dioxygenase-like lactoylglutathione lyase family enzyme